MNTVCLHCMSRLVALSGGSQGGEFTSAFGGLAEVQGRTASVAFDANARISLSGGTRRPTARDVLLACMRDLLEHDNADRALDLARAMAEVIRQQQEFVRLIQKLLEGTPVERAEMQAALEKERARRNRDGAAVK